MMGTSFLIPEVFAILGAALIMGLLIFALLHLVRIVPWISPSKDDTDFVIRLQGTLFTMVGLLLAFTLVQTQTYQRQARGSVMSEASVLNRMDRLLAHYGAPQAAGVRADLLTYTRTILSDDWPAMMAGKSNAAIHQAWGQVSNGILALSPENTRQEKILGEILRAFNDTVEARDERLASAPLRLPQTYWIAILFAVCMLLFISSTLSPTPFRTIILVAQMSALGAVLGFVLIQDRQFGGSRMQKAEPIIHIIDVMKARPGT